MEREVDFNYLYQGENLAQRNCFEKPYSLCCITVIDEGHIPLRDCYPDSGLIAVSERLVYLETRCGNLNNWFGQLLC